jgi:8-oxo-dGTP diphosphatase
MLQFGTSITSSPSSLRHKPRHTVFGIATKASMLACVAVNHGSRSYFDLPGGGVDPKKKDKNEETALIREFREETGLLVKPQTRLVEAGQFFTRSDGNTLVYNWGGFWTATVLGEGRKKEKNHMLCWLEPEIAIASLRHDSHAWFVLIWLRWQQRSQEYHRRANAERLFRKRQHSKELNQNHVHSSR